MNPKTYPQTSKNAALLYFLLSPGVNGNQIFEAWSQHVVLRDYRKPDAKTLQSWVEQFIAWRSERLYQSSYRQVGEGRDS